MNCGPPDHLAPCFLDLNWDRPMGEPEGLAVSELVGPLGGICNPTGEISPHSQYMNSSPKLHLSMMNHQLGRVSPMPVPHLAPFPADPGFVERATRFFIGGGRHLGGLPEAGKLSRAPSGHSLGAQLEMGNPELGNAREESSASDPLSVGDTNARKRKAAPKGKGKDPAISPTKQSTQGDGIGSNAKRCRSAESSKSENDEVKPKMEQNGGEDEGNKQHQKENNAAKPTEPHKDYIHVRARRGQATDSHSLAERVRRERISERMKLLQDLVPGCNKVTGRALMLDEIINYVQSLQRQVEFLSMKLASVNPQLDFNVESILPKDMHQTSVSLPNSVYPLEASAAAFPFAHQGTPLQCVATNGLESQNSFSQVETALHRTLEMQLPSLDGFGDATTQLGTFWGDDLHHVVQMGYGQSQEMAFPSQNFHDPSPASHMKIEL